MTKKVYTTKSFYYATYINVGGNKIRITFNGGSNMVRGMNGTYSTSDKAIQDTIESLPEFKNGFITIKRIYETTEQGTTNTTAKVGTITTKEEQPKEAVVEELPSDATIVAEVNTVQKAARYLNAEYGVAFSAVNNKDKIIKVAREHNVCFPNLK